MSKCVGEIRTKMLKKLCTVGLLLVFLHINIGGMENSAEKKADEKDGFYERREFFKKEVIGPHGGFDTNFPHIFLTIKKIRKD